MDVLGKIDWKNLDLSTPERLHEFAMRLEAGGRAAVAAAIADHKAAGNPIYYRLDVPPYTLVKEMPDGSRFCVHVADDGNEIVGEKIA